MLALIRSKVSTLREKLGTRLRVEFKVGGNHDDRFRSTSLPGRRAHVACVGTHWHCDHRSGICRVEIWSIHSTVGKPRAAICTGQSPCVRWPGHCICAAWFCIDRRSSNSASQVCCHNPATRLATGLFQELYRGPHNGYCDSWHLSGSLSVRNIETHRGSMPSRSMAGRNYAHSKVYEVIFRAYTVLEPRKTGTDADLVPTGSEIHTLWEK